MTSPAEVAPAVRPPYVTAPRGPLAHGSFYSICFGESDPAMCLCPNGGPDRIVSAGPRDDSLDAPWPANCAQRGSSRTPALRCPVDPAHVLTERTGLYRFDFITYGILPPIIARGMAPVVRREVADRLLATDLSGIGVCPVEVTSWGSGLAKTVHKKFREATDGGADLRHIYPEGRDPSFRGTIEPPGADRCPHCGRRPACCPGCDKPYTPCPDCGGRLFHSVADAPPEDRAAGLILIDTDASRNVVDPRRWDGSDYLHGVATRRFVDYLLSIHLWPFVAVPLPTLAEGLTDEELAKLDRARRPVVEGAGAEG